MAVQTKAAVFVFTTSYLPFVGGAEIAIQEIARRLSSDFDFFIFAARFDKNLPCREIRPEGTIVRIGVGRWFDKWLLLFLGPWAAIRERRRLRSRNRIILWGVDISAGSATAALLKLFWFQTPFVLNIQYGYGEERIRAGRFGAISLVFRFMLGQADVVTAISTHLVDVARRFGSGQEIEVIPNGVSLERYQVTSQRPAVKRPKIIITVSRLVKKNGIDILIRAIAELKQKGERMRCHIVGDGKERKLLETLAESLGLSEEVIFFGNVSPEAVPSYLAQADIFVRPSRSEGMGNAFLEALAAGLPIIGTPVGGITDIIKDGKTGLFCNVDDSKDLAEKISYLLTNRELAQSIAKEGKAMVEEQFSWDKIAASYRRIFSQALAKRMRILIATPQFPPDIGGPGSYAKNLAERLLDKGCQVSILTYGQKRKLSRFNLNNVSVGLPSGLKHFIYFLKAFKLLLENDAVLILDPVIVGFPVALACRLLSKPMIIRVEGDFLWEWHSERTKSDLTLRQFYEKFKERRLSAKEKLMYRLARFVFGRARFLVFSSSWRKDIFELGYQLKPEQSAFIAPPWPKVVSGKTDRGKIILFAGRFIHVKNLSRLIRVFEAVSPPGFELELISQGPEQKNLEFIIQNSELRNRIVIRQPVKKSELISKIASAHAFVLPSLSDVSPNVILDCLSSATPFLLTQESGFYETLKDIGLFVDPLDEKDIVDKLSWLFNAELYAGYRKRLEQFKVERSWEQVAEAWLELLRNALAGQ